MKTKIINGKSENIKKGFGKTLKVFSQPNELTILVCLEQPNGNSDKVGLSKQNIFNIENCHKVYFENIKDTDIEYEIS